MSLLIIVGCAVMLDNVRRYSADPYFWALASFFYIVLLFVFRAS
jgi:hypothetical protein